MSGKKLSKGLNKEELYEGLFQSLNDKFGDDQLELYKTDPVKFVREVISAEPEPEQIEILKGLVDHGHVAVRSGHGIGKSTTMAWAALWFICTHPHAKIPCTAPTSHQLYDIFFSELLKWYKRLEEPFRNQFEHTTERFYHKQFRESWFIAPRTARVENPEALQGFHSENLLFLIDEASGVPDGVFEVAMSALTAEGNMVLMAGNPTRLSGIFYDSFHSDCVFRSK